MRSCWPGIILVYYRAFWQRRCKVTAATAGGAEGSPSSVSSQGRIVRLPIRTKLRPSCSAPPSGRGESRPPTEGGILHLRYKIEVFTMNMQDFYTGHAFDAYEFSVRTPTFRHPFCSVWAPSAQHIAVRPRSVPFDLHRTQSAVWECDAPAPMRAWCTSIGARCQRSERGPATLRHGHDAAPRRTQHHCRCPTGFYR